MFAAFFPLVTETVSKILIFLHSQIEIIVKMYLFSLAKCIEIHSETETTKDKYLLFGNLVSGRFGSYATTGC